MLFTPLGIGSSFTTAPVGWTCNLVDKQLLIDVAPQAMIQLRKLKIEPDDISAVVITHLHSDHIFGFPFLLAMRSDDLDPLPVIGPEGTAERLELLCSISFSKAAPEKMDVLELPTGKESDVNVGDYRLLAEPTGHSPESLGYLVTNGAGVRLAYSGDSAWCEGLQRILKKADAAVVEMTFNEDGSQDHLNMSEHLLKVMGVVPENSPVLLTHLSRPREYYLAELLRMAASLPQDGAERVSRVEPAEELREYIF